MSENQLITGDSKAIVTNQDGIHENLTQVVEKHLSHQFEKPYQQHTLEAFKQLDEKVKAWQGEVILDACCGVGQSTRLLAKENPQALVIGVDKSANRTNRNVEEHFPVDISGVDNYIIVRANLNDFYRLVEQAKWPISKHYILYPNPWPKSKHLQRRWHGAAVFPSIIKIGQQIILRSNWLLYLEEFSVAAKIAGRNGNINEVTLLSGQIALTPFEAKFIASGQQCWQLTVD
ncbi:SAM-dependent methyltransferase [Thalassotalea sp. M1531]|uniref:tRNA (guanine(46)-N(7))-methyltransferase n=1 Tax=Thalassotalea algicola TaxID=2716224 RepID=A0A7Y0LCI5_9GAMM|nr:SAM-dependent methyltransferase [Thalassotalea algicola]NMP31792.1 SAM-dependent methyltransferase [Thalassotalea algicola]